MIDISRIYCSYNKISNTMFHGKKGYFSKTNSEKANTVVLNFKLRMYAKHCSFSHRVYSVRLIFNLKYYLICFKNGQYQLNLWTILKNILFNSERSNQSFIDLSVVQLMDNFMYVQSVYKV